MWSDILIGMRDHLRTAYPLADVQLGGWGKVPNTTSIFVQRGSGDLGGVKQGKIEQDFFLECWTYDADDEDAAITALDTLEQGVVEELKAYALSAKTDDRQVAITFDGIEPDGSAFLPACGSRMRFSMKITKRRVRGECV